MKQMSSQSGFSISSLILTIIGIAFIGLLIYSSSYDSSNSKADGEPWNSNMLMGSVDAPNKLIVYSDYFCSHCNELHEAAGAEFKKEYIDSKKLSFEIRIVTLLKDKIVNTEMGAEAAFCAADQSKFWEYSDEINTSIDNDYFSKGIGTLAVANPQQIEKLSIDYFLEPVEQIGMNYDTFKTCLETNEHASDIINNTDLALQQGVDGLPYVVVNDYKTSGFVGGYDSLRLILKAGIAE